MNRTTKAQLQSELQAAHAKIERLREIVSVQKCLSEAREVLAANPEVQGAELLAAFIGRVWWIDVEPEQLESRGETTTSLPPLSPQE